MKAHFASGLYPARPEDGFRMDGYYVWCGSCIRGEDGRYYLFASRWPEETGFPEGYMRASEIVVATAEKPEGPFRYAATVLSAREGGYWDSMMAHNPQIHRVGDEYLLYYIGTPDGRGETRRIGVARSHSLTDGWVRPDRPIDLPDNANNPAMTVGPDGMFYLTFRDGELRVSIARSRYPDRDFTVLAYDIFPLGRIEDMYLFYNEEHRRFEIIAEDGEGKYTGSLGAGAHFCSEDAVHWQPCEPYMVYDRTVVYTDGSTVELQRRERPQLLRDGGELYLFTTAKTGGETRAAGGKTWNMVQRYRAE